MHTVVFHMKRAFQSTLRVTRPLFESLGITPARFDMLSVLDSRELSQSSLRLALGVSAMTVSRMVRALEALGLVRRRISASDTRQRLVKLTEKGHDLLRRGTRLIVQRGTVERLLLDVLAPVPPRDLVLRRLRAFDRFDDSLVDLADAFGDTGRPPYPGWHPDS